MRTVVSTVGPETRFNDSILLYNIVEDYNGVLAVLNNELGMSLLQSSMAGTTSTQDVLSIAKSILEHYARDGVRLDPKKRETAQALIKLKESFSFFENNRWDDALVVRAD